MTSNRNPRIIAFAGSHADQNFFLRLGRALALRGWTMILLTQKVSIAAAVRRQGFACRLVHRSRSCEQAPELAQTVEAAAGLMPPDDAARFFNGVLESAAAVHAEEAVNAATIWNGTSIQAKALSLFANRHGIKTLYFELGNIPGKLFVDPRGANAQSLLYARPEVLDEFPLPEERAYASWKQQYLSTKRKEQTTPTARYVNRIHNYLFPVDVVAAALLNLPEIGVMNLSEKVRDIVRGRRNTIQGDPFTSEGQPYIFFPMQIATDSQLLFNSTISNREAIEICCHRAGQSGLRVLVKPHPAERDPDVLAELRTLQQSYKFSIVTDPSIQIAEHAREVVTINSTVGFEAMILGKPTTFLGASFYAGFDENRIRRYIMEYLVDAEYFSADALSDRAVNSIMNRIDLQ